MPDKYILYVHKDQFATYWDRAHSSSIHPQQRPQWYRLAIVTGVVMDYLDGFVGGIVWLNATPRKMLEKVNTARGLKKPLTPNQLREDLEVLLSHLGSIRGYAPRDSRPILVSYT